MIIMPYWVCVQLPPLFASCFVNTALLSGEYFMLWTKTVKQPPRGAVRHRQRLNVHAQAKRGEEAEIINLNANAGGGRRGGGESFIRKMDGV